MAKHNELGKKGEDLASDYLLSKGYLIVDRNWRYGRYEIDIIAICSEYIVFVEVKTRSSRQWENPEDAVSSLKIRKMIEAADFYLIDKEIDKSVRFDIIAVIVNKNQIKIDHIEDAFFAPLNI